MKVKVLSLAGIFAVALAIGLPLWAHHSHGNYQMDTYTTLTGTIKEMHWLNPHSWVYIDVKGTDDKVTLWALEGTGVAGLRRTGWTPEMLKPGTTVTARCHALKDGSPGCLLGFLKGADGIERIFD